MFIYGRAMLFLFLSVYVHDNLQRRSMDDLLGIRRSSQSAVLYFKIVEICLLTFSIE